MPQTADVRNVTTALHHTIECDSLPCPRCKYDLRAARALPKASQFVTCSECGHICNREMLGEPHDSRKLLRLWFWAIVPAIACAGILILVPQALFWPARLGIGIAVISYLLLLCLPFAHAFIIEGAFKVYRLEHPHNTLAPVVPAGADVEGELTPRATLSLLQDPFHVRIQHVKAVLSATQIRCSALDCDGVSPDCLWKRA